MRLLHRPAAGTGSDEEGRAVRGGPGRPPQSRLDAGTHGNRSGRRPISAGFQRQRRSHSASGHENNGAGRCVRYLLGLSLVNVWRRKPRSTKGQMATVVGTRAPAPMARPPPPGLSTSRVQGQAQLGHRGGRLPRKDGQAAGRGGEGSRASGGWRPACWEVVFLWDSPGLL